MVGRRTLDAGGVCRCRWPAGWILELLGLNFNLYDRAFGLALLVIANILIFNLLIWWCAGAMRSSDLRRRITEDVLRESGEAAAADLSNQAAGSRLYLVDLESKRVIDSNAAMEQLLGYARGELATRAGV